MAERPRLTDQDSPRALLRACAENASRPLIASLLDLPIAWDRSERSERSDLSGKTGSTNDYSDAWFGGFNSKLVTTAWAGFDNFSSLGHADGHPEFGAYVALPIWTRYMKVALNGMPPAPEPMPPGIVTVLINRDTGLPAKADDPLAMPEVMTVEDYERLKTLAPLDSKHGAKSYDVF